MKEALRFPRFLVRSKKPRAEEPVVVEPAIAQVARRALPHLYRLCKKQGFVMRFTMSDGLSNDSALKPDKNIVLVSTQKDKAGRPTKFLVSLNDDSKQLQISETTGGEGLMKARVILFEGISLKQSLRVIVEDFDPFTREQPTGLSESLSENEQIAFLNGVRNSQFDKGATRVLSKKLLTF